MPPWGQKEARGRVIAGRGAKVLADGITCTGLPSRVLECAQAESAREFLFHVCVQELSLDLMVESIDKAQGFLWI